MSDEPQKKPNLYHYATAEFKGRQIKPSKGRIDFAFAAGLRAGSQVSQVDILILIFACLCAEGTLMYAQRDPDKFLKAMMEWREQDVQDEDFAYLATLAKEILESSNSTKAEPVQDMSDMSQLEDPNPNEQSRTI